MQSSTKTLMKQEREQKGSFLTLATVRGHDISIFMKYQDISGDFRVIGNVTLDAYAILTWYVMWQGFYYILVMLHTVLRLNQDKDFQYCPVSEHIYSKHLNELGRPGIDFCTIVMKQKPGWFSASESYSLLCREHRAVMVHLVQLVYSRMSAFFHE